MKTMYKIIFACCFILAIASCALSESAPTLALLNMLSAGGLGWKCAKEIEKIEEEEVGNNEENYTVKR